MKKETWVIGGKNVDEDPHFSLFYLKPTAYDPTGICDYKEVYSYYDGFNETYFVKKSITKEISIALLDRVIKDPRFLKKINTNIKEECDQIKNWVHKNMDFVKNSNKYSPKQVFELYKQHNKLTANLYKYSRVPQALDRGTNVFTNYLLDYLKEKDPKNFLVIFHSLATPEMATEMSKADFELNNLIIKIRKNKKYKEIFKKFPSKEFLFFDRKISQTISDYIKHWGHLSYHGYGSRKLPTIQDIITRIKEDVMEKKHIDIKQRWKKSILKAHKQKNQYIKKFNIDKLHLRLFEEYASAGVIKMYRRSAQILNFVILDEILEYVSKKFNCPEYILRFMTHEEFASILKTKKLPKNLNNIKKRAGKSMYIFKKDKLKIITDKNKIQKIFSSINPPIKKKQKLEGITATLGNVTGNARIIFRPSDTFNKGDILVSESTDPDLLPIMKKAKAILTEQGGATSHACILARELNIPCIVGVEGLLDQVKNGDSLEINGNEGTVKIVSSPLNKNLIKNLDEIKSREIDSYGGKCKGLFFLNNAGFGEYLPKTYCGNYLIEKLVKENKTSELKKELLHILPNFKNKKIAIRSSGLNEDSKKQSWAGQFDTFLNLKPDLNITIKHLKKLYAKASKKTKSYLSDKELGENGLGFVLQEQIDPLYAGVLFTKDPVTNNSNKIVIEVVKGLGDKLVSGKSKPLDCRFKKSDLELEKSDKEIKGFLLGSLRKLAKISKEVERKGKMPQDIEFAIDKDHNIILLQSRPITT
jgi:phosphoenolpyruvate synthase/pyruvate phosphate dikinase